MVKKGKPRRWTATQQTELLKFVGKITRDEDLRQEVCLRVWGECDPNDRKTWEDRARRVASNMASDERDKRQVRRRYQSTEAVGAEDDVQIDPDLGKNFASKAKRHNRIPNGYKLVRGALVRIGVRVNDAAGNEVSPGVDRDFPPGRKLTADELSAREALLFMFETFGTDAASLHWDEPTIRRLHAAFKAANGFPLEEHRDRVHFARIAAFADRYHRSTAATQERWDLAIERGNAAEEEDIPLLPPWVTREHLARLLVGSQLGRGGGAPRGPRKTKAAAEGRAKSVRLAAAAIVNEERKRRGLSPIEKLGR